MSENQVAWNTPLRCRTLRLPPLLIRAVASSVVAALLLLGLFLLTRRWNGSLESPFGGRTVLIAWTLSLVVVLAARLMRVFDTTGVGARWDWGIDLAGSASLAAMASAMTGNSATSYAPALVWLSGLAIEASWYAHRGRMIGLVEVSSAVDQRAAEVEPSRHEVGEPREPDVAKSDTEEAEAPLLAEHVERQLTREVSPQGEVRVHGLVRGQLETGQRVRPVHVEFCPPFAGDPEVTAYILEGAGTEVRLTQAACFGARWEWYRSASESHAPVEVVMFFEARA